MKSYLLIICALLSNFTFSQSWTELPEPVGSFNISCISNIQVIDTSRYEKALSEKKQFRKLNFDLYYPTESESTLKIPYWRNVHLYSEILDSNRLEILESDILTNATPFGLVSTKYEKYPLIIFSPGWQAVRYEFTLLVENLVSLGNIVAILDHPYMGYANIDGVLTIPSDVGFTSYEDFRNYLGDDQNLILQYLLRQNNQPNSILYKSINMDKVASVGQSTGFLATKGLCINNDIISKCIGLDAGFNSDDEIINLNQQILILALEKVSLKGKVIPKKNMIELVYEGAGHFSVADWMSLETSENSIATSNEYMLLTNYAENINLFIKEDSLDSYIKKVKKHSILTVEFNGD